MQGLLLRKYGAQAVLDFPLFEPDGVDFTTNATFASGDLKVMKDEGAEVNATNLPVDEGMGYSLTVTATEMQAARIVLYVVDQTNPKAWLDRALVIETYGHASAMHAFDLSAATPSVDLSSQAQQDVADAVLDEATSAHQTAGTVGAEVHLAKAMLANKRIHTISTGVDVIKDDDGLSTLRTMTPTDGGSDTINVEPS